MSTAAATALPTRAELQDRVRRALDAVGASASSWRAGRARPAGEHAADR